MLESMLCSTHSLLLGHRLFACLIVQYFATDLLMHNGECHGVMAMCMEGQWHT